MDFHRLLRVALLQDHLLSPAPSAQLWPLRPRGTALAWEKSGGPFGREATISNRENIPCFIFGDFFSCFIFGAWGCFVFGDDLSGRHVQLLVHAQ